MYKSLLIDGKEGEVSCDCLDEKVSSENSLYEVVGQERFECKCERHTCEEECEIEKTKSNQSSCTKEDKNVVKKNIRNREFMRNKRAFEKLTENSEFIEKKRESNREYMQKKKDEENLAGSSEAIENKRALKREYMKNKRAEESLGGNSEAIEKKTCAK